MTGGNGELVGNSSYVYHTLQHPSEPVPGGGGVFHKIDSTNFPIATTIAATYVVLEPKGLRELHWHPTVSAYIESRREIVTNTPPVRRVAILS